MRRIEVILETRGLHELLRSMDGRAEQILEVGARNIEGTAKELAPVDTGALQNSIHVRKEKPLERIIADGVEYGIYQEFGTVHMGAQPFMTPAVERERPQLEKAWEELLK